VIAPEDILESRAIVREIYIDDKVKDYIIDVVHATRHPEAYGMNINDLIAYGASPRASIYLNLAAALTRSCRGALTLRPKTSRPSAPTSCAPRNRHL